MQPLTPSEADRYGLEDAPHRIGPHPVAAPESERAVLAAILQDGAAYLDAAQRVRPEDFYDARHRAAFAAMSGLAESGHPIDLVGVTRRLAADGSDVSGYYLTELLVESGANVDYHAAIVREKSIQREVYRRAVKIAGRAADPHGDALAILESLREAHDEVSGALPGRAFTPMREALRLARERVDVPGAPSRLHDLHEITGGWKPGKLYIGAGRPGMGKSSHAKTEALHVARTPVEQGGGAVAVFTMEMGADEYAQRIEDELEGIVGAHGASRNADADADALPIYFDDSARLTPTDIRSKLHRLTNEIRAASPRATGGAVAPLRLVVVDYLQLVQGRGDNREQEVAHVARELKTIAREFDVAVLALAQINRGVESRTDKRPQLGDLRESGEIEQAADVVLFYHRPEVYGAEEVNIDGYLTRAEGVCLVIVSKQRGGRIGDVWCRFHGPTTSLYGMTDATPIAPARTPF